MRRRGRCCFFAFHFPIVGLGGGGFRPCPRAGIRPEEERAGKGSVGTEEQDGLTGKDKEAENDEAHRARVRAEADPRVPNQVVLGH